MDKKRIIKVRDVVGFATKGYENIFESRLLIDKEGTGSGRLTVNHFTLKSGKSIPAGKHPCPFDEVYYVLRGNAILTLNGEEYEIGPDTAIFIPCETYHSLKNTGKDDFESVNISPLQYKPGVNPIYDERKKQWGKTLKFIDEDK